MFSRLNLTGFALYTIGCLCVLLSAQTGLAQSAENPAIRVLFLGNSLTAGYGLPAGESYPALLQAHADSLGWPVIMVNAGVSGDTSSGGLRRLGWHLEPPPDILMIALGGNDGLRGLSPSLTQNNLVQIIQQTRAANPEVSILIAGMQIPPNMGPRFQEEFRAVFPAVADEMGAGLIPFLLEGVGGIAELNQPDGIHPNAEGQRIMADHVWQSLEPLLRTRIAQ